MRPPQTDPYLFPAGISMRGSRAQHELLLQHSRERQASILEHARYEAFVREARAVATDAASSKQNRRGLGRLLSFFRRFA